MTKSTEPSCAMGEVLGSKKVISHVLQEAGFTWDYPHISEALSALIED